MKLADSNILLRILIGDVPAQKEQALSWLEKQAAGSVTLLDAVLTEVFFQLEAKSSYNLKRVDFVPACLELFALSYWNISRLTRPALKLFAETKLDYVDCILLAMKRSGSIEEVYSFDKKLIKELSL